MALDEDRGKAKYSNKSIALGTWGAK